MSTATIPRSGADRRTVSPLTRVLRMMRFETAMVFRQRNTLLATVLAPLFVLGFPVISRPADHQGWLQLIAPMTVLVMVFSVYITAATVVASRRENQILKRLRTSELTPVQMIVAMTVPLVLLGVVQVVIVQLGVLAMGGPVPADLPLLALATVGTALLSVTAGTAVGAMAPNSERVQYTAMPLLLLAAIGSNLVVSPADPTVRGYLLLAPFTGMVDLVARAGGMATDRLAPPPASVPPLALDLGTTVFWIAAMAFLAVVFWRWEPRR